MVLLHIVRVLWGVEMPGDYLPGRVKRLSCTQVANSSGVARQDAVSGTWIVSAGRVGWL